MKNHIILIGLLALLSTSGCTNKENSSVARVGTEFISADDAEPANQDEAKVARKLIKEGVVEFETENIQASRQLIFESISKHKGYVSSDQEYNSNNRVSNTIVIRVPASNFDQLLVDATKGVSKFDGKDIKLKDVTEEFLDVEARLKTKKELETRYLELLQKANTVTEILEVEKQVGQLRSEIESIEGRLKYLENQVSLSTLTITFYQEIPNETEFGNKFKNGFTNGWDNLIWFFVLLVNIWPFIIVAILLSLGFKVWGKSKNT